MGLPRTLVPTSNSSDLSDAALVARARAGDLNALGALYHRFARPMFGLARRLLGHAADAEDVLHDVFLGLPEALRHYDERGALDRWLMRLTARMALNRLRSERRRGESGLDVAAPTPARETHPIDSLALHGAIDGLPDTLRAVFVLKEIEGFSHAEIAALLHISRGASQVRFHRAIRALRTTLESAR